MSERLLFGCFVLWAIGSVGGGLDVLGCTWRASRTLPGHADRRAAIIASAVVIVALGAAAVALAFLLLGHPHA